MASLNGVEPKGHGTGVEAGWHRVLTDNLSLKFIGANKTPLIEQKCFTIKGGGELIVKQWVSLKGLPRFARYAEVLGCDESVRATMDTDIVETLSPMMNRTCWLLVDWVYNDQKKKWYREVTNWAPDSEDAPESPQPLHPTPPFAGASSSPAARPAGSVSSEAAMYDDDIQY